MTKFKRVLDDADIKDLHSQSDMYGGEVYFSSLVEEIEQTVLAKLAEQELVAYLYDGEAYGINSWDISDYIKGSGQPLYAHPIPRISEINLPTLPSPACSNPSGNSYFHSYSKAQMLEYAAEAVTTNHLTKAGETVPEGWQLVPKKPSRDMLKKMFYEIFGMDGIEEEYLAARYRNMLSSFPKYTGDDND